MIILSAIVFACGVLYFWLSGHWFGRILAFLVLLPLCAFIGAASGAAIGAGNPAAAPILAVLGGITGAIGSWFIAALPVFWRTRKSGPSNTGAEIADVRMETLPVLRLRAD